MKRMMILSVIGVLFVNFGVLATYANGQAEAFPVKPVDMYVGFPPGGFTAISGQMVAAGMKKYLNQPVIVNFKPGASQMIVAEFVKNSKRDGYTLFYMSLHDLHAKFALDKKEGLPVKVQFGEFESLGAGPSSPYLLAVNAESPWKTIEDFIAAARKSPGSLNYGSGGMGGCDQLVMGLFRQKAGIALNHIPFQGGGPATTALLGGHVQIITFSVVTLAAHVMPGGGLRPLMVFDKKRSPFLPDVPTALEKGYDIVLSTWQGLSAPKGLPRPVTASLINAFEKTMKDQDLVQSLAKFSASVTYFSPEEVEKKGQEEYKLFLDIWEKLGTK